MNGNSHVINSHSPSHSIPNAKNLTDNANNKNAHPHARTMSSTTGGNFVGNKIRNNVGHKASQMRRIQLSTAAKRCKSMDNNIPKAINSHKAATITEDDNIEENCQANVIDESTSANSSTSQAIGPRKLVKVKTWYTQSSHDVQLPATTSSIDERQQNLP